jgi:hypothetical protein
MADLLCVNDHQISLSRQRCIMLECGAAPGFEVSVVIDVASGGQRASRSRGSITA